MIDIPERERAAHAEWLRERSEKENRPAIPLPLDEDDWREYLRTGKKPAPDAPGKETTP